MGTGKRYFFRRVDSPHTVSENIIRETTPFEVQITDLPHNSRSITARFSGFIGWLCRSIVYSFVLFIFFIWVCSYFVSRPNSDNFVQALVSHPSTGKYHLDYLHALISTNRLDRAEYELRVITRSRTGYTMSADDTRRFGALTQTYYEKKNIFTASVVAYSHWTHVLKDHPHYRDGLYVLAQHSYILFDDLQTKRYLQESIELDPQFTDGKKVLEKLH
jgi:hypothetical protein